MMTVDISLISARENVGRKIVKILNLPLPEFSLQEFVLAIFPVFPVFPVPWVP